MMDKRLVKFVVLCVFLMMVMVPLVAFAQETTAPTATAPAGQYDWQVNAARALAAGLAMAVSAFSAAYAQAKIGSAGAGTLAERPEAAIWVIVLQALPEVIVLLGFVSAIMIGPK